jgi:hypothetical protein
MESEYASVLKFKKEVHSTERVITHCITALAGELRAFPRRARHYAAAEDDARRADELAADLHLAFPVPCFSSASLSFFLFVHITLGQVFPRTAGSV